MVDYADTESSPDQKGDVGGAPDMRLLSLELPSGCSNPIAESLASSSQSHFKQAFIDMGFPPTLVDKVLEEKGEENAELLLESLCAYSVIERSSPEPHDYLGESFGDRKGKGGISSGESAIDGPKFKDVEKSSPNSSASLDEIFNDCKDSEMLSGSKHEELDADCQIDEDKRDSLLMMKFSAQEVDSALDKLGEDAPLNELVDIIVAAQVANLADDNEKIEVMFSTMDVTLRLLEMGFSDDEISLAIEKYGAELPIEEIADSIFANRIADNCFDKDENPPVHWMDHSHPENYRSSESTKEEHIKRRSFDTLFVETEASSSEASFRAGGIGFTGNVKGKKPKLEYEDYSDGFLGNFSPEAEPFEPKPTTFSKPLPHGGLNHLEKVKLGRSEFPEQVEMNTCGSMRQMVSNRPYFFYGNVLDVSQDTWNKLSQFLYTFAPEFANTRFFSALSRKEGYIHNLPKDNRSHILPRSPMAIEDAIPLTKKWWPSWDTRKQLSSINSETKGIPVLCERLEKILIDSGGVLSPEQQTDILHHCKRWNLVWVGQYKLKPIEPEQVEHILGYPMRHTQTILSDPEERLELLKQNFQTDTLGYHLSALKWISPDGLTILSLYSGIGGAEIAIHRLGIRLKGVVSVDSSEANRRILKRWWQNTQQTGELVQIEDIDKLTSTRIKSYIKDFGGFDLVVCQNTSTHISGGSKVIFDRENPAGFDFFSFYEFARVLQCVRGTMGC